MARNQVEGMPQLIRELDRMNKQAGPKIARRITSAGGRALAAGIRRKIPKATTPGHSSKRLKKGVGFSANKKNRAALTEAKIGFLKRKYAPHAHLFILGTAARTRRRIGGRFKRYDNGSNRGTGAAPDHLDIVPRGVAASIGNARKNMRRTGEREVQKQRSRRRGRK